MSPSFLEQNRRAWDERVARGDSHTEPARAQDFNDPLGVADDCGWLGGNVRGQRVLCLAAGGGKHSVLLAAAGAEVTVVDLSPRMLALDREMAARRSLPIRVVETSMEDLSMLGEGTFDVVIQPVSTCYVPDVGVVYREVARVTRLGGIYISQHKQPACLQASVLPSGQGYQLTEPYYRSGPLPAVMPGCQHREAGTVEFLHRWEELLGGLCRAGFVIEALVEPCHGDVRAESGTFKQRSAYLPPFVTMKARRVTALRHGSGQASETTGPKLWVP